MINVLKNPEPEILTKQKNSWTTDLLNLLQQYHSFVKIPKKQRNFLEARYKHPEIINALKSKNGSLKCVYCESYVDLSGPRNVEHFHPKSLYPQETYEWDNLFICCANCNGQKNNFDTKQNPFIHPEQENAEEYLTFDCITYVPIYESGISHQKALNVIEQCDLDRNTLIRKHSDLYIAFNGNRKALNDLINQYKTYKSSEAKKKCLNKIYASICYLKILASEEAEYAGYIRYLLRKFSTVKDAVSIINQHKDFVGLINDFDWGFDF